MPAKQQKFSDFKTFPHCFTYVYEDLSSDFYLKGKWKSDFFKNTNPLVLELGCGYGEYTVGLARQFPDRNFLGIDIKSNRMWTGARLALEENLNHVAFLRTRVDFLANCFDVHEVDEIWITFPDPQPGKSREKKRLTGPRFLEIYRSILKPGGQIHLKTDSTPLFDYTLEVLEREGLKPRLYLYDLYSENVLSECDKDIIEVARSVLTRYEKLFSSQGERIKYLVFSF